MIFSFLEAMAEAAKSVCDYMQNGKGIVCINVMNRISVDCENDANPAEPDMHDIGILASLDPVALDQAYAGAKFWQCSKSIIGHKNKVLVITFNFLYSHKQGGQYGRQHIR